MIVKCCPTQTNPCGSCQSEDVITIGAEVVPQYVQQMQYAQYMPYIQQTLQAPVPMPVPVPMQPYAPMYYNPMPTMPIIATQQPQAQQTTNRLTSGVEPNANERSVVININNSADHDSNNHVNYDAQTTVPVVQPERVIERRETISAPNGKQVERVALRSVPTRTKVIERVPRTKVVERTITQNREVVKQNRVCVAGNKYRNFNYTELS